MSGPLAAAGVACARCTLVSPTRIPAAARRREVLLPAQLDHPRLPALPGRGLVAGLRSGPAAAEEQRDIWVLAELAAQVAQGTVAGSAALPRLDGAGAVHARGSEGFLTPLLRDPGLEQDVADVGPIGMQCDPVTTTFPD